MIVAASVLLAVVFVCLSVNACVYTYTVGCWHAVSNNNMQIKIPFRIAPPNDYKCSLLEVPYYSNLIYLAI